MKQYLGIDIAKHEHVLGARFEDGRQHGKAFAFANDERGFASLLERLRELEAAPEASLVVMESTGHYWMAPSRSGDALSCAERHEIFQARPHAIGMRGHERRPVRAVGGPSDPHPPFAQAGRLARSPRKHVVDGADGADADIPALP